VTVRGRINKQGQGDHRHLLQFKSSTSGSVLLPCGVLNLCEICPATDSQIIIVASLSGICVKTMTSMYVRNYTVIKHRTPAQPKEAKTRRSSWPRTASKKLSAPEWAYDMCLEAQQGSE
jgi:hypothetical protein